MAAANHAVAPPPAPARPGAAHRWTLAALLLLGVAARVWGAWASRYITDADSSVVALMARHMAGSWHWPVFFYGQAYMGSLEPAGSALMVRLLGENGFAVCLGPVLFAALCLPLIYAWGRDAGGPAAGLAALALCVLGPHDSFLFQFAARGGYMTSLLLSTAVLWLGARLAACELGGARAPDRAYLALGLLAGLGWWCSQMTAAAILVVAPLLAVAWRGRFWRRAAGLGLAGFLLGGAPFWWWNLRHGWASFDMASQLGAFPLRQGLHYLRARYDRFLGLRGWPAPARMSVGLAYLLAVAAGGVLALGRVLRRPRSLAGVASLAAAAHAALSMAIYVGSRQVAMNTGRYFVPMVPAMAVLAGLVVAALRRRFGRLAAALPVVAVVAVQVPVLGELGARARAGDQRRAADTALLRFLDAEDVEAAYAHLNFYPLNFHDRESIVFTPLRGERYPPFAERAELTDAIGVVENQGGIREFLALAGGGSGARHVGGCTVHYGFRAPPEGAPAWPTATWAAVCDQARRDARAAVGDRDADTAWTAPPPTAAEPWAYLEVRLDAPRPVTAVRLFGPAPDAWPDRLRVDVLPADGDGDDATAWQTVCPEAPLTRYFWSGPRPFWDGRRFRALARLSGAPVRGVRVCGRSDDPARAPAWRVSELELLGPGGTDPQEQVAALPALVAALERQGAVRVYADRWLSDALHRRYGEKLGVELPERVFPKGGGLAADGSVRLGRNTAVVVLAGEADATRAALERARVAWGAETVGPWVFFGHFAAPGSALAAGAAEKPVLLPLYWTGCHLLAGNRRACALEQLRAASDRLAEGRDAEAAAGLGSALALCPGAVAAAGPLLDALEARAPGRVDPAWRPAYREAAVPDRPGAVRFAGGPVLLGVSLRPPDATPGGTVTVRYFWQCPPETTPARWVVFAHFRCGRTVFQDDHALLADRPEAGIAAQPLPEVFREERSVRVPADAPAGRYELLVGLYDPLTGKRLRMRTALDNRRRAAIFADTLRVGGKPGAEEPGGSR